MDCQWAGKHGEETEETGEKGEQDAPQVLPKAVQTRPETVSTRSLRATSSQGPVGLAAKTWRSCTNTNSPFPTSLPGRGLELCFQCL